jgi:tetratricopeptide (TPR) repeat protein
LFTDRVILGNPPDPGAPVVVSAPQFESAANAGSQWKFADLPFAAQEGDEIAARIGGLPLHGPDATKDAVVRALIARSAEALGPSSPEILHFATHSFYIVADTASKSSPEGEAPLFRARSLLSDPMQRSGIALAGANLDMAEPSAESPGMLFAVEILDIDLRGTDLAVLSSCQSGLGEVLPGDGIQGLRRAFRAAGVKTVVSSLWKVPDEAASRFMSVFYDRLLKQVPRSHAFREAKNDLRQQYEGDPLFWAGFVLDGGSDEPLFRFSPLKGFRLANMSGVELSYDAALENIRYERWEEAMRNLEFVLESGTADAELRSNARLEKARVLRSIGRSQEAVTAYGAVIEDKLARSANQNIALGERGHTKQLLGDLDGAWEDYSSLLTQPGLRKDLRAWALVNRGAVSSAQDKTDLALKDWAEVFADPQYPDDQRWMAVLNQSDELRRNGQFDEAIALATTALESAQSVDAEVRGKIQLVLGLCFAERGDLETGKRVIGECLSAVGAPAHTKRKLVQCANLEALTGFVLALLSGR